MTLRITGIGAYSPLGQDVESLWEGVAAGRDGFRVVDRFSLDGLPCRTASAFSSGAVRAAQRRVAERVCQTALPDPVLAFAYLAACEALADAKLDGTEPGLVLVLATSAGAADTHDRYDQGRGAVASTPAAEEQAQLLREGAFSSLAATLCALLEIRGSRITVNTACASGGHALALARELLEGGQASRVLVVGADSLHPSLFLGFHSVGVLSEQPCGPFGLREGMSLGEGAAAIVLEHAAERKARGVRARASFLGWGGSSDAYHPTSPEPRGEGVRRSIEAALRGIVVGEGNLYYNAHGTGTLANDGAEGQAVAAALGVDTPVSSSKSQLGHTQGAAGVLEAVVTVLAIEHGALPPSLRSVPHRRLAPRDTIGEGCARPAPVRLAVSHSSAFGGTNVTLAFGHREAVAPLPPARQPVFVHGTGEAHGLGASIRQVLHGDGHGGGRPDARQMRAALRGHNVRRLDSVSTVLAVAAARALEDAAVPPRSAQRASMAMWVGMADGPQQSIRRFVDSRHARGPGTASASAFAQMVLNAPTGTLSFAHQLQGPSVTLWSGMGAGLQAIAIAATHAASLEPDAFVLAGGADEIGHLTEDRAVLHSLPGEPLEAAGLLILGTAPSPVRLVGWSLDGPESWAAAADRACGTQSPGRILVCLDRPNAGLMATIAVRWPEAEVVAVDERAGFAPAAGGALAAIAACQWSGGDDVAFRLVLAVGRESGSSALCIHVQPGESIDPNT